MGRRTEEPEHRFGTSPPLTIGVEEELLLVDDGRRLVAAAERARVSHAVLTVTSPA